MRKSRTSSSWKDLIEQKPHKTLSRREFLGRGLFTGTATVMLPHALSAMIAKKALAGQTTCPAPVRTPGGIAQIMRNGGPTVGAMFLNQTQVNNMNATTATNYGILGASDIAQVGANWYLAKSSPFALGLMTPPPGYTATTWNAVLKNTSLGGHYGPFNADDGAGQNTGLLGSSSPFKTSTLGKDLRINNNVTLANWAVGSPSSATSSGTSSLTSTNISNLFGLPKVNSSLSMTPAVMTNSAIAADSLSQLFFSMFNQGRSGASAAVDSAVCGFYGDSTLATTGFGASLFNPANIPALSSLIPNLTAEEQALLAAYYQSALGNIAGVFVEQDGCDYHGQSVQTTIAPSDYEAGRMVAMFLVACNLANTKGALITLHNGQAIASGTSNVGLLNADGKTAVLDGNGNQVQTNGPVAQGDAGGAYNAGFILAYDPSSPPVLSSTGTFHASNGNVSVASAVASSVDAVAGLYLTAYAHLGLNVGAATAHMQGAGAASNPTAIMLIS